LSWSNALRSSLFLFAALSCSTPLGTKVGVSGAVIGLSSSAISESEFQTIASSATISIRGRSPTEVSSSFDSNTAQTLGLNGIPFKVSGAPLGDTLVFGISASGIDAGLITFPYKVGQSFPLIFPVIPQGTLQVMYNLKPVILQTSKPIIIGALSPTGQGCSGYTAVDLLNQSGVSVISSSAQQGPYYFNQMGQMLNGGFQDSQCTFAIFNIDTAGVYTLKVLGSGQTRQTEVIALNGSIAVGVGILGVTF